MSPVDNYLQSGYNYRVQHLLRSAAPLALRLALCSALCLQLLSCGARSVRALEYRELFQLQVGRSENRIDLFQLVGQPMRAATYVRMHEGLFWIGNGAANKIMEFTSYGDLIGLIYDPSRNPQPVILRPESNGSRHASPYQFNQIGHIALGRTGRLLVEEQLGDSRAIYDEELGVNLDRIVLRFDPRGQPIDYIGQEGQRGRPFPFIEDIYSTRDDALVVVSSTIDRWQVFWYNARGDLLYRVEISPDRLPIPQGREVTPLLERIIPDQRQERLYLKLNYYAEPGETTSEERYRPSTLESRVYWLDLKSGLYTDFVVLPVNSRLIQTRGGFESNRVDFLYNFVGVSDNQQLYFLSQQENEELSLLVMRTDGRVLQRRTLQLGSEGLNYSTFDVSPDGQLVALLGYERRATVVWWRVDRLPRNRLPL